MKYRFGPSIYFANDKVIFDSLNQHPVNIDQVRELLNDRGILVSADTTKEELAKYFSRLTADYFDHKAIAGKLGRVQKSERITASEISGNINNADILNALDEIKQRLEENGQQVEVTVKNGVIEAIISYEHVDYTKIDLRQIEPRDGLIEFTKTANGQYTLRSSQNTDIDPIVESVLATLQTNAGVELERSRVNLQGIADPVERIKFFDLLIKNIEGYKFLTVTEAYCFKPKLSNFDEEERDDDEDELEQSPYVEKVSLRGEGVNRSFVIRELYDKGYYVIKVVWRVQEIGKSKSDYFELEAQFSQPESCTGFSYKTRSAILLNDDGAVSKKRRTPRKDESDVFYHLIEQAAKAALSKLTKPEATNAQD